MTRFGQYACDLCGTTRPEGAAWFLVTEDSAGTLEVHRWDDEAAARAGTRHACSADHVDLLVCAWMGPLSPELRRKTQEVVRGKLSLPPDTPSNESALENLLGLDRSLDIEDTDPESLQKLLTTMDALLHGFGWMPASDNEEPLPYDA